MDWLKGTGVALVTPFSDNIEVDFTSLHALVQHVIAGGVDYLVVLGTTAESATLSPSERLSVLQEVISANDKKLPIIVGCGGNNTAEVLKLIQELQDNYPINGFLAVCPYYNKPNQEGLFLHYSALAKASKLPIMLYNVPSRTGVNLAAQTAIRLAQAFDNIVAIKESSGNFEQGMDLYLGKPDRFKLISGDDIIAVGSIAYGFEGCVSVLANAFPQKVSSMVNAALQNDYPTARKIHFELYPSILLAFKEGNPVGIKAILNHLNICASKVRLPLAEASPELKQLIAQTIK